MLTRACLASLLVAAAAAQMPAPARAQVISGESTYEDNFLHSPPRQNPADENRESAAREQPQQNSETRRQR